MEAELGPGVTLIRRFALVFHDIRVRQAKHVRKRCNTVICASPCSGGMPTLLLALGHHRSIGSLFRLAESVREGNGFGSIIRLLLLARRLRCKPNVEISK
jgi:hypothetical protein